MEAPISSVSEPAARSWRAFYARIRHEPVYVILGVQGSGTNLLRSILVRAFNFSVVQDQAIVFNAAARVGSHASAATAQREFDVIRSRLFPSAITRKTRRRIAANSSFAGIEQHFNPATIRNGADLALFVYAYGAFSLGTPLMAIKSDDLWKTIGVIDRVLPNRRIVLLTRDFRDNLLSITNKNFGPREPVVAARYVKERFACYDAEYHRTPAERRFHIRYEDLVEAPDTVVARFGQHFGLTAADGARAVDKGRIRQGTTRRWVALRRRKLAQCEAILRDELLAYGYGTGCNPVEPPGPAGWLLAKGRDTVKRIPQKLGAVTARLRK